MVDWSEPCSSVYNEGKRLRYPATAHIGEGAFSEVHLARCTETGAQVALKRVFLKDTSEGRFPILAFRELQSHRELIGCPRIVPLLDHYVDGGCLVLVQPAYPVDLAILLDHAVGLGRYDGLRGIDMPRDPAKTVPLGTLLLPDVRGILLDILTGLTSLHEAGLMHRDIKPANVLVDDQGSAFIGDLGLVRPFAVVEGTDIPRHDMQYTAQVSSRWYRAPEVLLGSHEYGPSADCWGAGAVGVELLTGKPMAPGGSDIDQLSRVFAARGTPTSLTWPGLSRLPDWGKIQFDECPPPPIATVLGQAEEGGRACKHACETLRGLLTMNPATRWTARQALQSTWLWQGGCTCACENASKDSTGTQDARGAGTALKTLIAQAAINAAAQRRGHIGSTSDEFGW